MADLKPERERADSVGAYKGVLKRVLDTRPSGTRHRLAIACRYRRHSFAQREESIAQHRAGDL